VSEFGKYRIPATRGALIVRVPTYRLHKASGQAIVTINKRDFYLGEHGSPSSKAHYKRLIAEYLGSDASPSFGMKPQELSTAEMLVAYRKYAKKYYSLSEFRNIKLAIDPVWKMYGESAASGFGPVQFKACRQTMIDRGVSRNYINSHMRRVVRAFKWASGEGLVSADIAATLRNVPGLKRGRTEARETEAIKPVELEHVEATLPYLPPFVADMVQFQLAAACRPGEACKIKPAMLDRSVGIGNCWRIELVEHKTAYQGRPRTIWCGPKAQAVLAPYLLRDANEFCCKPRESDRKRREKAHQARVTPLTLGNVPGSKAIARRGKGLGPRKWQAGRCYTNASYGRAVARACLRRPKPGWMPG
jgi:integrase